MRHNGSGNNRERRSWQAAAASRMVVRAMKLALWQTVGYPADVAANLAALQSTAQAAATAGAELLLCPECWLCGYNIGAAVAALAESSAPFSVRTPTSGTFWK